MHGKTCFNRYRPGAPAAITGWLARKVVVMALTLAGLAMTGNASLAATIERHDDPVMECTLRLSGLIEEGDAERLRQALADLPSVPALETGRLCLNSPGGSYLEGVRLAQVIRETHYLGTAIAQGDRCESACAIAFMAGGYSEGAYDSVRPIMHPQSRLGFHAPSIDVPAGQYTEREVTRAWNISLQAIAEIVDLRSGPLSVGDTYNFPEPLFLQMLRTPPQEMYHIETVEQAARYGIAVHPVGLNAEAPQEALKNLCMRASGWETSGPEYVPVIRSPAPDRIEAFFATGFNEEAMGSCRVVLDSERLSDLRVFKHAHDRPIAIEFDGTEQGGGEHARASGAFAYMSFDPSTRLEDLPRDIAGSWETFASRIEVSERSAVSAVSDATTHRCWLFGGAARVVNVNEYVNMRRQPGFSAPIVRRVPLGERLQLAGSGNAQGFGSARQRQNCQNACQALDRNPSDAAARARAQQCIDDNVIWYEVLDERGNRGWISRRFLQQAG